MTRADAIEKVRVLTESFRPEATFLVDSLIALDLLKVEQPRSTRDDVHDCLQRIMTEIFTPRSGHSAVEVGHLSSYGAGCILSGLENAGLKIVKQDPR